MKKSLITLVAFALILPLMLGVDSCDTKPSADQIQAAQTARMSAEAQRQTGAPGITNFTERKFVKYLYELRDQDGFATHTYIVDFNGGLHYVCESVGYGIPYSAQYVNPDRIAYKGHQTGIATLPQPEPNGLFTPDGLAATWVLCTDGEGGIRPVYSEPALLVSPFKLKAVDSYASRNP